MMKWRWLGLAVLLGSLTSVGEAQVWGNLRREGYHASTAAEGYRRGTADIIRSAGYANVQNSEAAINYTEARSRELDNRVKAAETFYEKRRVRDAYKDEQANRRRERANTYRRPASDTNLNRLTVAELDPVTGDVAWPPVLELPDYDSYRGEIEQFFARRAEYRGGQHGGTATLKIQESIRGLSDSLKANVKDYSPNDWIAANRFVKGLGREVSVPIR